MSKVCIANTASEPPPGWAGPDAPGLLSRRATPPGNNFFKLFRLVVGYAILSRCRSFNQLIIGYVIFSRCYRLFQSFVTHVVLSLNAFLTAMLIPNGDHATTQDCAPGRSILRIISKNTDRVAADENGMNVFHRGYTEGFKFSMSNGSTHHFQSTTQTTSSAADEFQYVQLPTTRHIRLLKTTMGTSQDGLIFELVCLPVEEAFDSFIAVSYCWGTDLPSKRLTLSDGRYLQITANVEALLTHIFKDPPEFIWIDAVCINQHDNVERFHQVQMMRDIYASARRVSIWLGHLMPEVHVKLDGGNVDEYGSDIESDNNNESDSSTRSGGSVRDTFFQQDEDWEINVADREPLSIDLGKEDEKNGANGNDPEHGLDDDQRFFAFFVSGMNQEVTT